MIIPNHKWSLIFHLVLFVAVQEKVKVIRLLGIFGWNEDRVYFMCHCITKFANPTQINFADEKGEDFIGFGMVFFDINVSAKEDNILKRNGLSDYFIFVFGLKVCDVDKRIDTFFLYRWESTLLNLWVWVFNGYLNSLTIFREERPAIVCSLYAILIHSVVFYSICYLWESLIGRVI